MHGAVDMDHPVLDASAFPHLLDLVLDHLPSHVPSTLTPLRLVSRRFKVVIDRRLCSHTTIAPARSMGGVRMCNLHINVGDRIPLLARGAGMLPAVDPYGVHMRAMCGDRNDDAENENARAPPDPWLAARYVPDMQDALQHVQVLDLGHVRDLDEAAALGVRAATVRILTVSIFSVHHTQQRGWHSWHNPRAAAAPVPTWPTDLAPTRLVLWVSVPFESGVPLRLRRLRRLVLVLTYGWECSAWDPAALDLDVGEGGIPEIVVQCHKRPTETVCGCISHPSDSAGLSAMLEPLMGPDTRLTLIDPPRDGPLPDAEVIPLDMWNRDADPVEISWEGIHGDRVWRPWIGCRRRAVE